MTSRLVLCLGDLFIPDRAMVTLPPSLSPPSHPLTNPGHPPPFRKLLSPGKIGQILCLGNLTDTSTYDWLRSLAPELHIVRGDFDVDAPNLPLQKVVTHTGRPGPLAPSANAAAAATGETQAATAGEGGLRIGFTHGHTVIPPGDADALLIAARQMDVDVLCWGGTHRFEAYEMEGKFFVNPGSATGALASGWWADGEVPVPSFCLMDVQGETLIVYVYQLKKDESGVENVTVEKVTFKKPSPAAA